MPKTEIAHWLIVFIFQLLLPATVPPQYPVLLSICSTSPPLVAFPHTPHITRTSSHQAAGRAAAVAARVAAEGADHFHPAGVHDYHLRATKRVKLSASNRFVLIESGGHYVGRKVTSVIIRPPYIRLASLHIHKHIWSTRVHHGVHDSRICCSGIRPTKFSFSFVAAEVIIYVSSCNLLQRQ